MRPVQERGFTILELMVVVAAAAVIAGIGIPQLRESLAAYRLAASANLVSGELNAGRTMAVSRANVHEVTLNTTDRTIEITDPNIPSGDPAKTVRSAKYLDPGVNFSTVPAPTIVFYSRGLARGGTIVLQNEFGDTALISVNAGGKITVN